jgi:presenilin-like A22 family membrane protease
MVGVLVWGVATVVFIALLTQGVGYAMDRAGLLLASSVVAIVGLVVAFVGLVRWRRATRGRGAPDEV